MLASADAIEIDGIYYNLNPVDKIAEVTYGNWNPIVPIDGDGRYSGEIAIPESVDYEGMSYSVTSIGYYAFEHCENLNAVTIPSSVTSIYICAFSNCSNLTSITIPNSVTSIERNAFRDCSGLISVSIPGSVTYIGESAFYGCSALTSITIPNSVSFIGSYAFQGCSGLTSFTIPDGMTSISEFVFNGCTSLVSVTLPEGLTSIGNYAFQNCSSLTFISIPSSVTSIGNHAFRDCSLTSLNIPNSITSIGDQAFRGCSSLTSLSIPSSVTFLGISPFYGCTGLTSIKVEEGNIIYDSRNNCNAIIKTDDNELITGCNNTLIPDNVSSIAFGAFSCCSGLTSVTIPNGVTSIGNNAFEGCTGLTSITIPSSVTSIGEWFTFCGCSGLNSIIVEEGNTVYDSRDNCNAIIKTADNKLIYGCNNTVIPNNVTSIGNYAFSGCSGLTSITIPNGVTSIESYAFESCSSLTSIKIPNGVTSIETSSFQGCSGLTSITIPNNVISIAELSFNSCSSLTSVIIGKSVTSIGYNVFSNCMSLNDFYCYAEKVPETDNTAFDNSNIEKATLHVPAASVSAYQAVEPWKNFKEIVALPDQGDETDNFNYIPFVKKGKTWHVVRSDFDTGCHLENYMMNEEVVKDGKTYFSLYSNVGDVVRDLGLLREENRKVYFLPPYMQEEFLLFDYSLKEGDTFETYSYDEQKMVSYEVVSVGDYLEGPEFIRYLEKDHGLITQHRNLQKWTVCRTDDKSIQKTWIEGIGSFGGPLDNLYDAHPISTIVYLAYVDDSYGDLYLPFSFHDSLWGLASGCDLPTGAKDNEESDDGHHHLTYELEGDRLHVYGKVITQCGPNNYAYFFEKETDDPSIHMIEFEIQEVEPTMDCDALHATDFYVSGFDPNLNYIVVDNRGEEHPVINKTQQMAYRPFIEDNKVWIVRVSGISPDGSPMEPYIEYCYLDGDTIIGGQTCKRMMYVTNDNTSPQYIGAWYEQDKKVYYAGNNGQQLELLYDFTLSSGDNIQGPDGNLWTVNKKSGDITGFKGTYYDLSNDIVIERWFEGVGSESWPHVNHPEYLDGRKGVLLACIVGDDVIYYNSEEDDPYSMGARKRRFDFTHTIKTKPRSRTRSGEETEESLYGEYNEQQLSIHLDQIDDTYLVSITDESGKTVYEKEINAGNIVALNIDISTYAEGRYTVTVENSRESFTGEFGAQTTGIKEISNKKEEAGGNIYNLQGQRLSMPPAKGFYIQNGKKIVVK